MASHVPRPAHLGPRYAAMFADPDVARSYAGRPPYPDALFGCLLELADPACPVVLDGLHSQNGLGRHALGPAATAAFDAEARAVLEPFASGGRRGSTSHPRGGMLSA